MVRPLYGYNYGGSQGVLWGMPLWTLGIPHEKGN